MSKQSSQNQYEILMCLINIVRLVMIMCKYIEKLKKKSSNIEIKNRLSDFKRKILLKIEVLSVMMNLFSKDKKRLSLYVNIMLKTKIQKLHIFQAENYCFLVHVLCVVLIKISFFKEQEATSV